MRQFARITSILIFLLGSTTCFTGCVAVVAGGAAMGGAVYVMGDLTVPVMATPEQLEQAIKKGAQDLGLKFISGYGNASEGSYLFRNVGDDKITVRYKPKSPVYYNMSIRFGTFGNEEVSARLNQKIQKYL